MLRPELPAVIGAERFLREIKTIANLPAPWRGRTELVLVVDWFEELKDKVPK